MIERLVWDRFRQDWKLFGRMGLWTFLSGLPVLVPVAMFVAAWFMGGSISSSMESGPMQSDELAAGAMMRTGVVIALVFMAGFLAIIGLVQAGLMAQVVAFRRGQQAGFTSFWGGVRRHWVPMLLPAVFWAGLGLWGGGSLLADPVRKIGTELLVAFLALHLGIYPAYLIVADDMGGMSAMGRGLRILVAQPREALAGVLALWLMQMAVGLLGELVGLAAPFLLLPWAIFLLFYVPLVPYYFAERFEQRLRPVVN
ncbi:MAG: hypothetical protein JWN15_1148 [Firmicutes bacterium]|nr:hypothetical protein [Bacillota bacterium]